MGAHSNATNGNGLYRICDDHSDRLTRLEDELRDVSLKTVAMAVSIEHIRDGVDSMSSKLDTGFEAIRANTEASNNRMEKLEDSMVPLQSFVSEKEKKSLEKRDIIKKVILAVLTAAAGAVGTMLVNWMLTNAS